MVIKQEIAETAKKATEGFFKIESIDASGKVIDVYEKQNMIMERSKASVANATMGVMPQTDYINKFVLGDSGHDVTNGNLLVARDFEYERTQLFAEDKQETETYTIVFDPQSRIGDGIATLVYEGSSLHGATTTGDAQIKVNIINVSTIEYVITIDAHSANGGPNGVKAWTEAALYTKKDEDPGYSVPPILDISGPKNGKIFAMRTFPAKVKENTTTFRITWQIVF